MKIYLAGPVVTNDINIKKQMDLLENAINSMNKLYNIEIYLTLEERNAIM